MTFEETESKVSHDYKKNGDWHWESEEFKNDQQPNTYYTLKDKDFKLAFKATKDGISSYKGDTDGELIKTYPYKDGYKMEDIKFFAVWGDVDVKQITFRYV